MVTDSTTTQPQPAAPATGNVKRIEYDEHGRIKAMEFYPPHEPTPWYLRRDALPPPYARWDVVPWGVVPQNDFTLTTKTSFEDVVWSTSSSEA